MQSRHSCVLRASSNRCSVPSRTSRNLSVGVFAAVRARWSFDARYGHKSDAMILLQDWVRDVGSTAGITASNTRLSTGSIGVPEARLEMEVEFGSTSEWEQFLLRIPAREHKAWSQRAEGIIIDGSPRWEVFNSLSVEAVPPTAAVQVEARPVPSLLRHPKPQTAAPAPQKISTGLEKLVEGGSTSFLDAQVELIPVPPRGMFEPDAAAAKKNEASDDTPSGSSIDGDESSFSGLTIIEGDAAAEVILDWKGDPMTINPKDKLPFKFL